MSIQELAGRSCVLVQMPAPESPVQAFFAAVVLRVASTCPQTRPRDVWARVFTLEATVCQRPPALCGGLKESETLKAPSPPQASVQVARAYPPTLDTVRHAAQSFGILHDYHPKPTDVDNDLFFRIGMIGNLQSLASTVVVSAEDQLPHHLETQPPLVVEVRLDDICFAVYEDNSLPVASADSYSLADPKVTGEFLTKLFA